MWSVIVFNTNTLHNYKSYTCFTLREVDDLINYLDDNLDFTLFDYEYYRI